MGTSGAYGGSGTASWDDAHDLYEQVAGGGRRPPVEDLVKALTQALNKTQGGPPPAPGMYAAGQIRPSRPAGTAGYTRSKSLTGGGGGRPGLAGSAARGAAAVAGASAYRARDAQGLAELGLDMAALDALPDDTARCEAIAQELLGVPTHPEDAALKSAAMETMLEAMEAAEEPDAERLVEMFTGNLTYEFALIELTSEHRKDPVPPSEAAKMEQEIKEYIASDISNPVDKPVGKLSKQGLIDKAARLAQDVLSIFRRTR
ncbi:hypothetical protein M6B22_11230 [Jatrophihabitans cynanchi]|uniref:Uncharacterized protein n=1 Tax=Jatrophihabitans cynanchi TaxID=2944128 RepID=A0ABY7JRF2_9ACTN|nr:hypothetical protein [Jatrophihabitans sp. SB3-54]WAX55133.1 hypothetical protein M6B22_11230 [Jatrophihabitans sp. SB3-54]